MFLALQMIVRQRGGGGSKSYTCVITVNRQNNNEINKRKGLKILELFLTSEKLSSKLSE